MAARGRCRRGEGLMGRICYRALVALLVVPLLGAVGCGGGGGGGGETITIGASLPLTGDFSQPGGEAKRGYQIWSELVNQKGGLLGKKVKLIIRDDASDQNTVV